MEKEKINQIQFLILLGFVTALFIYLFLPFFFSIFWAAVLAGIFKPVYNRLTKRLPPGMAAGVSLVLIVLIIIIPAGFIGSLLIAETMRIYKSMAADVYYWEKTVFASLKSAELSSFLSRLGISEAVLLEKFTELIRSIANYIFVHLTALTQNTLAFLVKLLITLYSFYYLIKDSDKIINSLIRHSPLGGGREKVLYERFLKTANTTIKATLLIGGLQGILGGVVFLVTGIPGALLWGIIMMISSIIPVVGCSIIWGPAGIIMLLTGHIWEGMVILLSGLLVISLIDNLLRPLLIGRDMEIHPLVIFLSILGGIFTFGFSGFIVGPIIAALFFTVWDIFKGFYKQESTEDTL